MDRGQAMLKVVQDVYEGGRDLIRRWQLLSHAQESLRRGGPDGLKRYYERCLDLSDARGARVKATLERHGRKTLESEYQRFLTAYNAGAS